MKKTIYALLLLVPLLHALEPITPLPKSVQVDTQKALLGKDLFLDTILSKDNSTACVSCHNIYEGGADSKVVSQGFEGKKGNIQAPTVFNARYNFKQFWNGRAANLYEQANGPITNPAEHNMTPHAIEEKLNTSKEYRTKFKDVFGVDEITYNLVIEAIVEFENALVTSDCKFDRYLRSECSLSEDEQEGYLLFKQFGCITCHNGLNIGGNSFQKMGTFIDYNNKTAYPDRSAVRDERFHNVFKVPTLRNIAQTAPYFHDGSANSLEDAIKKMAEYNLGVEISDEEVEKIVKFLNTLTGKKPAIVSQ